MVITKLHHIHVCFLYWLSRLLALLAICNCLARLIIALEVLKAHLHLNRISEFVSDLRFPNDDPFAISIHTCEGVRTIFIM